MTDMLAGVQLTRSTDHADEILTPDALAFVAQLKRGFEARRQPLLADRRARQDRFDAGESRRSARASTRASGCEGCTTRVSLAVSGSGTTGWRSRCRRPARQAVVETREGPGAAAAVALERRSRAGLSSVRGGAHSARPGAMH
jgi:malate synthase